MHHVWEQEQAQGGSISDMLNHSRDGLPPAFVHQGPSVVHLPGYLPDMISEAFTPHTFLEFFACSCASCSDLSWQLSLTLAKPSSTNFRATFTAVSGSSPSKRTPYSLLAVCTTFPSTALPTTILRRNSRASQAKGSSSVAGLLGVGRLASLGASMLVNARILSAGGPFLGGPRITTAPPSMTCLTTPLKYCLGAAGAAAAAAGALSVCSCCADIFESQISIQI